MGPAPNTLQVINNYRRMEVIKEVPLYKSKHVDRASRSIETVVYDLTCIIQKILDEKQTAICAFLDISDALDNSQ